MTVGRDPTAIDIGAGTIYWAPIGTAEFTSLTGVLDAAFIDLGYTEAGSVFTVTQTAQAINVDEEYYRISNAITEKAGTVAFALAQITAKNMQVVNNGGTITTPGGGVMFEPLSPGSVSDVRCMLAWQSRDASERYLFRQCYNTGNITRNMKKATPAASLSVTFELEKPSGKQPWAWFGTTARLGS